MGQAGALCQAFTTNPPNIKGHIPFPFSGTNLVTCTCEALPSSHMLTFAKLECFNSAVTLKLARQTLRSRVQHSATLRQNALRLTSPQAPKLMPVVWRKAEKMVDQTVVVTTGSTACVQVQNITICSSARFAKVVSLSSVFCSSCFAPFHSVFVAR